MPDTAAAAAIGRPSIRVDGIAKVTGAARYPADEPVAHPAHAALVTSSIARGRIRAMQLDAARAVPGVLDILTHANVGQEVEKPKPMSGGDTTTTLESDRIWHDGQIIGVVVAESFEAAREAAQLVRVDYEAEPPSATFGSPGAEEEVREPGEHKDVRVGDAEAAFTAAEVRIDARYGTPTQHHNPIELFTTTCQWEGGRLTVHEPSQFVHGSRRSLAQQLRMDPADIRVISRYVGGAFGAKGALTARTPWIAVAARRLGRPVKLVPTRDQGFTIATYRAETRHHIQLGATRDGRLTALRHEGWEVTSRPSRYNVSGTETTARMYACPNILTKVNLVHADRNTPGFMRAPPDTPYMFALESAMDELAAALEMDPVELRRRNDTMTDPVTGKPFTSRSLMRCFDAAATRFGWPRRSPQPGSMRDGDWLIGWGCATACYPANIGPASASVSFDRDGRVRVRIAAHEIGNGAYTVLAIVAAERLGVSLDRVAVELGDTALPAAGLAAGSNHTASISHAVAKACAMLLDRLRQAAVTSNEGPLAGLDPAALSFADGALQASDGSREALDTIVARLPDGRLEAHAENVPAGLPPEAMGKVQAGEMALSRGFNREDATAYAFGAQFVEVRVHETTREIRVPRATGAFAAGRIVNPLAAHSQFMGGMIWGIGAALHEATEIDPRAARYVNDNIAEYLIPVNADVRAIDVIMVPEADARVNPLGIKGIGEVGIVGMNAAVANAVWHATGRRIRGLPIRIEDLLG
ncbi:xanthine dehydrogenase family protein molybdopterin-binding subunit [Plastoroseomonas hellenica]|uniref:xanthine dehydrogenase family protein molybdopterin-binding subunit n=1 Tax=Plastoroseomonas hellenica TaxID=2687306 RepID=UPI001BA6AF2D|nr:xanthine dehydrogenase family protein molybdopterin-binding subunit [Plastoroseomonas hellenica]MBR0644379.1 xanthine dehydrogenase family protein molybdopterin-binding subunit [Plastoroseomonas hellenica]